MVLALQVSLLWRDVKSNESAYLTFSAFKVKLFYGRAEMIYFWDERPQHWHRLRRRPCFLSCSVRAPDHSGVFGLSCRKLARRVGLAAERHFSEQPLFRARLFGGVRRTWGTTEYRACIRRVRRTAVALAHRGRTCHHIRALPYRTPQDIVP